MGSGTHPPPAGPGARRVTQDTHVRPSDRSVVTVIVPCRNPGPHFRPLLESLAKQDLSEPWEVIIVDNGSTDGSRAVASEFAGRLNVTVVDASHRANASYARNVGVRVASGDKLLFVDADDEV